MFPTVALGAISHVTKKYPVSFCLNSAANSVKVMVLPVTGMVVTVCPICTEPASASVEDLYHNLSAVRSAGK